MTENKKNTSTVLAISTYLLYILSLFCGVIPAIIGIIIAYYAKDEDTPEWLQSHYDFQIRTFWCFSIYLAITCGFFGLAYYFIFVFASYLVDASTSWLWAPMILSISIYLFTIFRIIVRSVKGLIYLNKSTSCPRYRKWIL
ncbi:MAG: hypothetical protein HOI53_00895 [Francisellaceae bacterium]|nr:hypothetical protein [Francisellaceae bacterium]MBT6206557.1 hypothetical protein [Francisellaceae bacterium]MBT6538135.1 hypothetical protein [Francisellaceae bacterium]